MAGALSPDLLLSFYRRGVFPMADSAEDADVFLVDPERRGVIPLSPFTMPARLRRKVRKAPYRVTVDSAFPAVMRACAAPAPGRTSTWINSAIYAGYVGLHQEGFAHSIECWQGEALVGGLYGVRLGAAFFGESMFSTAVDASKIALVYLAGRLQFGGFLLLDAQFRTPHLAQFGCEEISRAGFRRRLSAALSAPGDFFALPQTLSGDQLLQSMAHTS
jgi:leucyl/phenylalanyl-tRNA---protein transferase